MPPPFVPIPGNPKGQHHASGGAGHVYIVNRNGTKMAVKQVATETIGTDNREIAILRNYTHPNIMHSSEVFQRATPPFITSIVMPLCSTELCTLIYKKFRGPVPENTFAIIMSDIVKGLNFLHSNGIVHCDLKAENCLVNDNLLIVLNDFGHARVQVAGQGRDDFQVLSLGTPVYLSPEVLRSALQFFGHGRIQTFNGFPSDRYSLGCILYELATGTLPYSVDVRVRDVVQRVIDIQELLRRVESRENELEDINESYDEDKEESIRGLLQLDPDNRPRLTDLLRLEWVERNYSTSYRTENLLPLSTYQAVKKKVKGWLGLSAQ